MNKTSVGNSEHLGITYDEGFRNIKGILSIKVDGVY